MEEAQRGRIHLFFVDAAHFVLKPFLGYLYSRTVRFLKSSSGRKRFSVLGALHVVTQELVVLSDHAYINATSVCALLQKLHDANSASSTVPGFALSARLGQCPIPEVRAGPGESPTVEYPACVSAALLS